MGLDDLLGDGETDTGSLLLGGIKGFKDTSHRLPVDSFPRIFDDYFDTGVALPVDHPRRHRQYSPLGHRLHGVQNDVQDRLDHLFAVDPDRGQVPRDVLFYDDPFGEVLRLDQGDDPFQDVGNTPGIGFDRARFRIVEKTRYHVVQPVYLARDDIEERVVFLGLAVGFQVLGGGLDRSEGVSDLVREGTCHLLQEEGLLPLDLFIDRIEGAEGPPSFREEVHPRLLEDQLYGVDEDNDNKAVSYTHLTLPTKRIV